MDSMTRDEIRAVDRCAIDTLGIPGVILMENAGRACTQAVLERLGDRAGRKVAVVAGAGNNGGDGYVIARQLAVHGVEAVTFLVAGEEKIPGDAAVNLAALRALHLPVRALDDDATAALAGELAGFHLIVDAVGGTGIRGGLRGRLAVAVEQINAAGRAVVAVDIPTGLDCDTGEAPGPVVRAAMTVTFAARKKGFDAPGADAYTGEVRVAHIGIPADRVARIAGEGGRGQ